MNELITKVEQWAKDKGLDQTDSSKQMLKTIEEIGEVAASLARKDEHGLRDGIGDVVVTLIILAMQNDMDLYECLNQAYNEIKGRTGKMVDGVFVKSSDLKQLDEPKKLIVKPIVAGWIEKSTDFFTKAEKIAYLIKSKDGDSYYFCDWFVRDGILTQEQGEELLAWAKRQSYETLLSLYNGYEVEKEPLYYVKLPVVYFNHLDLETYLMKDDRGNITIADNNDFDDMKFTESEIKAIDERFWPFAVPVEEEEKE
ncbi:DUF1642 domain-containing protein [Enterococcus faecium]|uniref:DUF1642 domain-containing protein n=2 Tax=Enterococcus faecium TaxID=1352 RepID=UPI00190EA377|nr:DUF1642 domain-containing protein [Enterococcus faecium]MBK4856559.1 hypothetical protein [Enterococcus faecium]MBK4872676.1 hypothetical protein [Enterococcus faecium]MBK4883471.1 hypothetical protein [Enterococcus faecium]